MEGAAVVAIWLIVVAAAWALESEDDEEDR